MRSALTILSIALFAAGCAAGVEDEVPGGAGPTKPPPGSPTTPPADGGSSDDTGTPPEDDTGTPPEDDTGTSPPTDPKLLGGGTGYATAKEMFDHVNATRTSYSSHIPYDGYPFMGVNATARTWSLTMTWDEELAAAALKEAQALAAGSKVQGTYFTYPPPTPGEPFWLTGLDSPRYMLSAKSSTSTVGTKGGGFSSDDPGKWHLTNNGMYRLAVAYQTGSKTFSHKTKLGVGMASAGPGEVWWVLVFGE